MATAKQKAWRKTFAQRYGFRRRVSKGALTVYRVKKARRHKRGGNMARYRRRRSRGGFGGNRLITAAIWSAGAAFIAPKLGVNVDPRLIGAGVGYWKGGLMGAGVGYFVPTLISGATGGNTGF